MGKLVMVPSGRHIIAFALASATAALLAGCSSDTSTLGNPFADSARFGGSDRIATGTIRPPAPIGQVSPAPELAQAAPTGVVTATPLAPVRAMPPAANYQTSYAAPAPVETMEKPVHGGASVATAHGVWSADGGTPVAVHQGENAAILAERYSVPVDVLIKTNGLISAAQVRPGSRVIIPVYSAGAHSGRDERIGKIDPPADHRAPRRELARNEPLPPARPVYHFVKGPSGLDQRQAQKGAKDHRLAAKESEKDSKVQRDARVNEQGGRAAHGQPEKNVAPRKLADAIAPAPVKPLDKTSTSSLPPTGAETGGASPDFRWPARGRIIAGFKPGVNDGINIAVPDGTSVKAVDDGVVAYAGDELKGYGNLVLIRHSNGFVSAYANNGEIDVKRGQMIKRGQVIAKSGQSGNVSSPQLHFELRKGQTPVDPTHYLGGA